VDQAIVKNLQNVNFWKCPQEHG